MNRPRRRPPHPALAAVVAFAASRLFGPGADVGARKMVAVLPFQTRVAALGGRVALPKMAVPGVGWLAYAKDTEGNIFGLIQTDPTAA